MSAFLSPLDQAILETKLEGLPLRTHLKALFADSIKDQYQFQQFPNLVRAMALALRSEIAAIGLESYTTWDETEMPN
jgi:hypothetical protein